MVIKELHEDIKKALQSIILPPIWDSIKSGGECKAKSSKNKKSGTVPAGKKEQEQQLNLKFHGSHFLQLNDEKQFSYIESFVNMIKPFDEFIGKFATVEIVAAEADPPAVTEAAPLVATEAAPLVGTEAPPPGKTETKIRLNLEKLMRREESVVLGKEGRRVHLQLHFKVLRYWLKGSKVLTSGTTLKRLIAATEAGVRKLHSYEMKFKLSNGEDRSGTNEEDLLNFVLERAWAEVQFRSLAREDRKLAKTPVDADGASDADSDFAISEVQCLGTTSPPNEWTPAQAMNATWIPDGWPCYIAYVCEKTRCTDKYLHLFTGGADNVSSSSAKSRKEIRVEQKEKDDEDRKYAGEFELGGKRGVSIEETSLLLNTSVKRSSDKAFQLATMTNAENKRVEQLLFSRDQYMKEMQLYQSMLEVSGVQARLESVFLKLNDVDNQLTEARAFQSNAMRAQRTFNEVDDIGQRSDIILRQRLGIVKKRKNILSTPPRDVSTSPSVDTPSSVTALTETETEH